MTLPHLCGTLETWSFTIMDPMAPSSPEPPISPNFCHSSQVCTPLSYLTNYHCSFVLASLHEPYTYREANIDLCLINQISFTKVTLRIQLICLPLSLHQVVGASKRSRPRLMKLLNDTRLAQLPKVLPGNIAYIMRKILFLLLALPLPDNLLSWQLFTIGLSIIWM